MQWRGINLSYHYFLRDEITVGFTSGWSVFRTESDGNVSKDISSGSHVITLTGKQYRYVSTVPVLAFCEISLGRLRWP